MSDQDVPEYAPEVTGGRGYLVSIPRFFGDSAVQMNKFYGTLAGHVTQYFERLCGAHRSLRCSFEVSGTAVQVHVTVHTVYRERGQRIAEQHLSHVWCKVGGVWLLCREKDTRRTHRITQNSSRSK